MANLGELALAGLGLVLIGGYSSKTRAGEGLSSLGAGVTDILASPGRGFGFGLQETAKGFSMLGDVFGSWFDWLPDPGEYKGPAGSSGALTPDSGDASTQLLPGGGGNVPEPTWVNYTPLPESPTSAIVPDNEVPKMDLTKGLDRIYQMNGDSFGFRKAPGLEFGTRKEARNYLKAYQNDPMEGTSL